MAEYVIGSPRGQRRIGILPSAFNPPTVAHLALATAAQRHANLDQIVFALPRELPHKSFSGASPQQRMEMLRALASDVTDLDVAVAFSSGGLFIEIAREFKQVSDAEIFLICGKDAAERIVHWDYDSGPSFDEQLNEFTLLVGDRGGTYEPLPHHHGRTVPIEIPQQMNEISSESLRSLRAEGNDWKQLTLPSVARLISEWDLYR